VDLGSDLGTCDSEAGPTSRGASRNSVAFGGCAGFLDFESGVTKWGTGVQDVDRSYHAKSGYYRMLPRFVIVSDAAGRARWSGLKERTVFKLDKLRGTDVAWSSKGCLLLWEVFQSRHFSKLFVLDMGSGEWGLGRNDDHVRKQVRTVDARLSDRWQAVGR
jgi:hypothetical protein